MGDGYSRLIKKIKKYNPNCDFALIEKAHNLSLEAHKGQQRESGDPFIVHPMEVANILADLELDCTAIVAVFFMILSKIHLTLLNRLGKISVMKSQISWTG